MDKLIKLLLSVIVYLTLIFPLSICFSESIIAQTCRSFCEPSNTSECSECDPQGEWFCSNYGSSGTCCYCLCGLGGSTDYGPVDCMRGSDGNRFGCLPCPSPTSAVAPTPTPSVCCVGSDFCKYIYDYYDCKNNSSCSWSCDIPDPTPSPAWWCKYPGADPNERCRYETITVCVNPDVPGGACYSNQDDCEHNCVIPPGTTITPRPQMNPLCSYNEDGGQGINSAIGCFPIDDRNEMLIFILRWSLGVGGGITFLLIVYSGFLIMGSGANVERVKAGKDIMTGAIAGLIVLIFSVFILDFIGLRIFRIPGL